MLKKSIREIVGIYRNNKGLSKWQLTEQERLYLNNYVEWIEVNLGNENFNPYIYITMNSLFVKTLKKTFG